MHEAFVRHESCAVHKAPPGGRRERGVFLVLLLTAVMMLIEISVGYATGSMALLADGWHMATHVGALGLASVAYWFTRRYAGHRAFAFGTGKIRALAGFTSAIVLSLIALAMITDSIGRILTPHSIDFASSLPVAAVGLVVNLVSVALLHTHKHDDGEAGHVHTHGHVHAHGHDHVRAHDHNHRAVLMHVMTDAFTSALAIVALLAGRYLGWNWMDAVTGVTGGLLILKWGFGLSRLAACELLDVIPSAMLEDEIRGALEAIDDVRVHDLHVWPLGGGAYSCVVTLAASSPREPSYYRAHLVRFSLAHLTIEVARAGFTAAAPAAGSVSPPLAG